MAITPLKTVLTDEGRRQDWLAAKTGIDPAQISRMANRGMLPTIEQAQRIAEALEKTVAELFPDLEVAA